MAGHKRKAPDGFTDGDRVKRRNTRAAHPQQRSTHPTSTRPTRTSNLSSRPPKPTRPAPPPPTTVQIQPAAAGPSQQGSRRTGILNLNHDVADMIFDRCSRQTVKALRQTQTGLGRGRDSYLYRKLSFSLNDASINILKAISQDAEKRKRVKTIVFEDIGKPLTYFELMYMHPELDDLSLSTWQLDMQDLYLDESAQEGCLRRAVPVLRTFENLECLEYFTGMQEAPTPSQDAHETLGQIVQERGESLDDFEKRLWVCRGTHPIFSVPQPEDDEEHYIDSLEMFDKLVGRILSTPGRTKPLDLIYNSAFHRMFIPKIVGNTAPEDRPASTRSWPKNNVLRSIDIRYQTEQWGADQYLDFHFITNNEDGKFDNLRELRLSGKNIANQGTLGLTLDGKEWKPTLPSLEKLSLTNVDIDAPTFQWIRSQPVHLELHDVFVFPDEAFPKAPRLQVWADGRDMKDRRWKTQSFFGQSLLRSVRVSGLFVLGHPFKNTRGQEKNPRDHAVYVVGNPGSATLTAQRYSRRISECPNAILPASKIVSPEALQRYIQEGKGAAPNPLKEKNCWMRSNIFLWVDP